MDFGNVLGPNLQFYYCYLASQMADFTNGGVFLGPKIRHFRGLTVPSFCSIVVRMLGTSPGDHWFEPGPCIFAKQADFFFMIFEVYPTVRVGLQARERY